MPNRQTLLLITHANLARVDVLGGKSPRVEDVWIRERMPGESTATLVDAAIRLGPKKTGDVWVLSDEVWTGVIQLADDVARALESDELQQAIGLEAENFSGISAFESRIGKTELPRNVGGESCWWVTLVAEDDWHEVEQVVSQFGGKLAGMGHPTLAAFPTRVDENPTPVDRHPWCLIQAFGESTVAVEGCGKDVQDVMTFGDLKTQRTRSQLIDYCEQKAAGNKSLAWVTDQPMPELLVDSECPQIALFSDVADSAPLADPASNGSSGESSLRNWAETMAATLPGKRDAMPSVPVVIAEKSPMSSQTATLISCGLGLLVALGCCFLHIASNQRLAKLDAQIAGLNQTKKSLSIDKQTLQKLEKQFQEQQKVLANLRESNQDLSQSLSKAARIRNLQKTRWFELVAALAKANESDCWVKGLETHGKVVTVKGLAVTNQDISAFASNLEEFASPHGWRVHPAETEQNDIALIEFEVSLDVSDEEVADPNIDSAFASSSAKQSFTSIRKNSVRAPSASASANLEKTQ